MGDIKDTVAQRIAEKAADRNYSTEQINELAEKVVAKIDTSASEPVEPQFAGDLFQEFVIGSKVSDGKILNTKPSQDYNQAWDTRLKQKTYSAEELQKEVKKD